MDTDLVPMSIGDIFDEAFDLYKRNFTLFAGIVAVVHVPGQLLWNAVYYGLHVDRVIGYSGETPGEVAALLGTLAVGIVMALTYTFLAVVQNGALAVAISDRYLGRSVTIAAAYRATLRHGVRLVLTWLFVFVALGIALGIALFAGLMVVGMSAAAIESMGGLAAGVGAALVIMWAVACLVLEMLVGLLLGGFVTQVVVVEGRAYAAAIGRNWQLLRGRTLRILGGVFLLLLILLGMLVALYASIQLALATFVYPLFNVPALVDSIVSGLVLGVIWMFLQPYVMTCLTLLYYDQRVRREGLDLSLLEQQMHGAGPEGVRA